MKSFKQFIWEEDNEKLAAGILFHAGDTGRYAVALRSKLCDQPHTWGPIGGSAQDDEGPIEAVIREVKEEAGITITKDQLEPLDIFKKKGFQYHTFICRVSKESDVTDNLKLNNENDDLKWFTPGKPPKPLHPGFAETLGKVTLD